MISNYTPLGSQFCSSKALGALCSFAAVRWGTATCLALDFERSMSLPPNTKDRTRSSEKIPGPGRSTDRKSKLIYWNKVNGCDVVNVEDSVSQILLWFWWPCLEPTEFITHKENKFKAGLHIMLIAQLWKVTISWVFVRKFFLENTRKTRTIPSMEHFPCFLRRKGDFKRSVFKEWERTCFPDVP